MHSVLVARMRTLTLCDSLEREGRSLNFPLEVLHAALDPHSTLALRGSGCYYAFGPYGGVGIGGIVLIILVVLLLNGPIVSDPMHALSRNRSESADSFRTLPSWPNAVPLSVDGAVPPHV
jgi:hypothetical protein